MSLLKESSVAPQAPANVRGNASPLLILAGLLSLSFVALPLLYLIRRAAQSDFESLRIVIFRAKTLEVLLTTVMLVALVATLATVIGFLIAWSLHAIRLPLSNLIRALSVLPIAIPSYVFTYSWLSIDLLPSGFLAAVIVLTLSTAPYVTLAAMAALRRIDSSQVDVAQTLGLNQLQILTRITLPQVRNALSAGALLVALYVLSDFGAVSLLGVDTFTRAIQNTYQGSFDRSSAAVLALMLVSVSSLVIGLETSTRRRSRLVKSSVSITRQPDKLQSIRSRVIATGFISLYLILALVAPLSVLIYRFIARPEPINLLALFHAAFSTVVVSSLGAAIALVLALPIAILALRATLIGRAAERGVLLVNALPGIVMGLALVAFGSDFPWAYQTIGLLALSYSILFLARSVGTIRTSLSRVPENLTEIAATLGQSKSQIFHRVTLPLAAPGVLTGTLLVFLSAMKELPATLMLRPTGFETLATEIWNNTAIFRFSEAAPYALLLVAIAAIPTFLISRPDRDSERGELQ
ncbi:MAG: iron ABC transporter permease [Candidatus Nanopelagicaceae bacterium]|nr:iron ABC transporter permease [Candidatus Nanopelagicaceae bacterium]